MGYGNQNRSRLSNRNLDKLFPKDSDCDQSDRVKEDKKKKAELKRNAAGSNNTDFYLAVLVLGFLGMIVSFFFTVKGILLIIILLAFKVVKDALQVR